MGWGDELMVTGQVRELQRTDPRKVRVLYERPRWHEAWANNPRIAGPEERGDFQVLQGRVNGLRPYAREKQPQRWLWQPYTPPVGELYFGEQERAFGAQHAGLLVIEPHIKDKASPNKIWGWHRWSELVGLLLDSGLEPVQLGPVGTRTVAGARLVVTKTMRHAAAVMAHARAAVLPEGGLHHVAAAVGLPAVVIFGGYISPEVTGYAAQRSLFAGGEQYPLGCGMRTACEHCEAAMASITPRYVAAQLEALIEELPRPVAA